MHIKKVPKWLAGAGLALLLGGCHAVLLDPSGDVALRQRNLIYIAVGLMLIVILPVITATVIFAWRYRSSNSKAKYEANWDHSTRLELVIWSVPLLIIITLGGITWVNTHQLDPYRPLSRISATQPMPAHADPLTVEVVALDWKWLFIYPQYGFATENEMAAPVNRPIQFKITASSVMNSFFIPALAGQIYAMPGMQTQLHAVINKPGDFKGISANYSGAGFSGMHFTFKGLDQAAFNHWVQDNRAADGSLDRSRYLALEKPSKNDPVRRWGHVEPDLYARILNRCVRPGTTCMDEMQSKSMEK